MKGISCEQEIKWVFLDVIIMHKWFQSMVFGWSGRHGIHAVWVAVVVLKTEAAIAMDPSMVGQSVLDLKMIGRIAIHSLVRVCILVWVSLRYFALYMMRRIVPFYLTRMIPGVLLCTFISIIMSSRLRLSKYGMLSLHSKGQAWFRLFLWITIVIQIDKSSQASLFSFHAALSPFKQ